MSEKGNTAYVTGGASGIGRAITNMLIQKGAKVFIADRDISGAQKFAEELNSKFAHGEKVAFTGQVDVISWDQQLACFETALKDLGGRIDYVYPIAGIAEKRWLPKKADVKEGFAKPDLQVLDADLTGVLYTIALAVQQFRRQEKGKSGWRGKIGCVASVCGFYCCPTLPVYTAAKHGLTGFVRSYGKYLPEESIALNAVNPNVIRTNISASSFYDKLEAEGLLTPMDGLIDAFESILGSDKQSGEIFEVPPKGAFVVRGPQEWHDEASKVVFDGLYARARPLQVPE